MRPARTTMIVLIAVMTLVAVRTSAVAAPALGPTAQPQQPTPAITGSIAGVVVDAGTAAPLAGVLVQVQGASISALTDGAGRFALTGVPAGRCVLFISTVGYALARPIVDVPAGSTLELDVRLAEGTGAYSERVEVAAPRADAGDEAVPLLQTLGSKQLQDLRGVLADDPLRAVQALPGVATGDDFNSEFSVRGSDPAHIGLAVDGVPAPWLLHTVRGIEDTGSISLINSDVLESITLASGSYPQDEGVRTGAWLSMRLREGSRERVQVRAAVSGTNASLMGEGPLGSSGRGSWLASIRQSYLHWLLQRFDEARDTAFGFTDVQVKFVYDTSPKHQVRLTLVGGRSNLDEQDPGTGANSLSDALTDSGLASLAVRSILGPSLVLTQRASVVAQRYANEGVYGQALADGDARDIGYRADVDWNAHASTMLSAGIETTRQHASEHDRRYVIRLPGAPPEPIRLGEYSGHAWEHAAFVDARWRGPRGLTLRPGVRVAHTTLTGETTASPWLLASLALGRTLQVRTGAGVYRQRPDFAAAIGPAGTPGLESERARHVDLALAQALPRSLRWQVTLFDRQEHDMIRLEGAETKLVDGRVVVPTGPGFHANALRGEARGIELMVGRDDPNGASGWLSYAYGRTRQHDAITRERFWADDDQRHGFNAYVTGRVSERMSVSAKFRAGSNMPIAGYLEDRDGALFASEQRNLVRLPTYARLDVRANRVFNFTRRRLSLFVEVLNVLNRTNLGPADGTIRVRTGEAAGFTEELLPILPSAGILVEF